jgi:hypothetical protein
MADQGFEMEKELLKRMGKTEEEIEEQLGKTVVGENGELKELPPGQPPSDSILPPDETIPRV